VLFIGWHSQAGFRSVRHAVTLNDLVALRGGYFSQRLVGFGACGVELAEAICDGSEAERLQTSVRRYARSQVLVHV